MPDGHKIFAVGETLTASDVNGYLMEQVTAVFASEAARDAAISSPVAGLRAHTLDTGTDWVHDGSTWGPASGLSSTDANVYDTTTTVSVSSTSDVVVDTLTIPAGSLSPGVVFPFAFAGLLSNQSGANREYTVSVAINGDTGGASALAAFSVADTTSGSNAHVAVQGSLAYFGALAANTNSLELASQGTGSQPVASREAGGAGTGRTFLTDAEAAAALTLTLRIRANVGSGTQTFTPRQSHVFKLNP